MGFDVKLHREHDHVGSKIQKIHGKPEKKTSFFSKIYYSKSGILIFFHAWKTPKYFYFKGKQMVLGFWNKISQSSN